MDAHFSGRLRQIGYNNICTATTRIVLKIQLLLNVCCIIQEHQNLHEQQQQHQSYLSCPNPDCRSCSEALKPWRKTFCWKTVKSNQNKGYCWTTPKLSKPENLKQKSRHVQLPHLMLQYPTPTN